MERVMRVCDVLAIAWGATLAWREISFEIARIIARMRRRRAGERPC